MARNVCEYDSNGLARVYQDAQWCLIDQNGNQICDWYTYIEECESGLYIVETGSKKNLLRPDGSLVLKEWHHEVFDVEANGLFIFKNTIRKSKNNPQTRSTYGIGHISGNVIFPMVFDKARWTDDKSAIYAEIEEKPYWINLYGSLYDPSREHLPHDLTIDSKDFFEKFANWTLPGLQFFYRDTDAPVIIETTYFVGDILRAGSFIDATTKLQKPAHKTRFLIASAHAAMLCEIDDLCEKNPKVKEWNLCTFHYNSYFKVMDIYEKNGVTQVFLLHLPKSAAYIIGYEDSTMNFLNEATGQETTLIDMARKSLDEKMLMDVHPRSYDKEFSERTFHPIGLDNEFYPVSLEEDSVDDKDIEQFGNFIHKLADDADIKGFLKFKDKFPYKGVKGSICEGCIYANGIRGNGEGCGRLFIKSFRNRYLKGICEYRKTSINSPSRFEEQNKYQKQKERESIEKNCDKFALDILRSFVKEKLNGDIKNLKYYNFNDIVQDKKYGNATLPTDTVLMKSILSLAFADVWSDFTYESIDKYKYKADTIHLIRNVFGLGMDDHYKALIDYDVPEETKERVITFGRKYYTIGNTMVLPSGLHSMRDTKALGRGYIDVFLQEFYKMMIGAKKCNTKLLEAMKLKKKEESSFRTKENFSKIAHGLMLDDFLDEEGIPKNVFEGVFSWDLNKDTFVKAANEYIDICEPFLERRADRIIEKLETILNLNK